MTLRMGALYDALRQAPGVTEDAARLAAEEVASYKNRIRRTEDSRYVSFGTESAETAVWGDMFDFYGGWTSTIR